MAQMLTYPLKAGPLLLNDAVVFSNYNTELP
jgi:hypothetical protein